MKHYINEILKIFEKEKNTENTITSNDYIQQVKDLFDLEHCNIFVLQAIRDAIVSRLNSIEHYSNKYRFFYSEVSSYVTYVIDEIIASKGGIQ